MNRDTAVSQQLMNMVDTSNPWGTTKYTQNGSTSYVDSQGKTITIPKFTQTTKYTPEQQAIFDRSTQAQTNIAQLAVDQSAALQGHLSKPFEFNNRDAEDWAYDIASSRILPQQQRNESALRDRLINSGIRPGDPRWNAEMERMTMANTDQLNQLALQGRSMAYNEARDQHTLPINTITALLSGSQISQTPSSASPQTPQTGVAGVDYTGLVNNKYQAEMANHQSMMGGLFGLGGTLALGAMKYSDARLKENIRRVGATDAGQPVYVYNYIGDPTPQMGVMAQESPADAVAVDPASGYLMVDYGKVH